MRKLKQLWQYELDWTPFKLQSGLVMYPNYPFEAGWTISSTAHEKAQRFQRFCEEDWRGGASYVQWALTRLRWLKQAGEIR